jgi:hypothetical protein
MKQSRMKSDILQLGDGFCGQIESLRQVEQVQAVTRVVFQNVGDQMVIIDGGIKINGGLEGSTSSGRMGR